ncbi:zinc-ribbon domain-containing protein [Roseibaca sp. Y0-43]|uniref:zinc-ribbon domain-containing protein n=1 Tax=Roseibaca sp. Y0-43 TaxID=2816854 RepID=UPI001D0C8473|nr:zinc-ribbon domain-containing protein [Roseibaca sp. Y0-43]MCC1480844.1 zinc-ribbon domain-containing protein [Roseibaca sp. Y0-43]
MRLICPSCAAQYEVDASLLPDDGTEVQCSSCGTVWFQPGKASPKTAERPAKAEPPQPAREAAPQPAAENVAPPVAEAPPVPQAVPQSFPRPERPKATLPETPRPERPRPERPAPPAEAATEAQPPAPPARALDPAVADVLRGEAEFEAKQRAREESGLETQQELGLFGPALSAPASKSGASSLPDIDDISSTLEPVDAGRGSQPDLPKTEAARKRSFVSGLLVPVVIALVLAGLYLLAPMLVGVVPALDGVMTAYVTMVDTARLAVAGLLGAGS